jgi:hypothetical protein
MLSARGSRIVPDALQPGGSDRIRGGRRKPQVPTVGPCNPGRDCAGQSVFRLWDSLFSPANLAHFVGPPALADTSETFSGVGVPSRHGPPAHDRGHSARPHPEDPALGPLREGVWHTSSPPSARVPARVPFEAPARSVSYRAGPLFRLEPLGRRVGLSLGHFSEVAWKSAGTRSAHSRRDTDGTRRDTDGTLICSSQGCHLVPAACWSSLPSRRTPRA